MKLLKLTNNKQTLLDDQDYEWTKRFIWKARKQGHNYYAYTHGGPNSELRKNVIQSSIALHRELLGLDFLDKRQVDHINGNGLDNRRFNLRVCTALENTWNRHVKSKTSKYKGIHKKGKRWSARIKIGKSYKHLGYYNTDIEAALAYDKAATKYFKEFAKTNF